MTQSFHELRERLLRAGVAPRHVRRYLTELSDHLADLRAEEAAAGRSAEEAAAAALARLGDTRTLADAMIQQRQFQAWCARAPWATFGLAPLAVLAGAYLLAGLILWTGWRIFLPGTETPFVPVHGPAMVYFAVGRLDYFGAPVLIGWVLAILAARQRARAPWPLVGLILIALAGGVAHFHALAAPAGEPGQVGVSFSLLSPLASLADDLRHAVLIFSLTAAPYLLWRSRRSWSPAA